MRTSKPIASLALALVLAGCGAPSSPTAQADAASAEPASASATRAPRDLGDLDDVAGESSRRAATGFLVWTRDGEGHAQTHRLDTDGREVETLDGVFIATPSGIWQWREEERALDTYPCERYDEEGALLRGSQPEPGGATRAVLAHVDSGAEQLVVEAPSDAEGAEDFQQNVELVASVGPLLFVRHSTYVYTCGAHGTIGVSGSIWNASTGAIEPLPDDLRALEPARSLAMRELVDDDDGFPATDDTMELTELLPGFERDGSLRALLQFTAPTCYACSRGNSGSYTKSAVVDAERVPGVLAPYATPPKPVREFVQTHPSIGLQGWSVVAQQPQAGPEARAE